jgi:tripartite ATP-independent transporter DctP family solute receptor
MFSGFDRMNMHLIIRRLFLQPAMIGMTALAFLVSGCRDEQAIIIRYAHVGVKEEPQSRFAEEVASIVNKKTDGRVQVRVYPNSQLGNISELVDGVKYGFIGMTHHDFASLSKFHKDLSVFNAPYIFRDVDHALKATNPQSSPILAEMNYQLIEKTGIRILGSFYRGTRQLTTNSPVYGVDDLKGKKIRGVPFPVWMSMIRGMGAIPTPVEFSELTTALMTGMVEGQENPLSNIYASKIYEVQSHVTMTGHMHSCLCVFIHEKLWWKIEERDRETILKAVSDVSNRAVEWILESDREIRDELESLGMIFIDTTSGLDIHEIRSSVMERIHSDFPQWQHYIDELQKIQQDEEMEE